MDAAANCSGGGSESGRGAWGGRYTTAPSSLDSARKRSRWARAGATCCVWARRSARTLGTRSASCTASWRMGHDATRGAMTKAQEPR
eukprot:1058576-Prorocentrum_minimum.AAC.1